jgi:hypothetical protein
VVVAAAKVGPGGAVQRCIRQRLCDPLAAMVVQVVPAALGGGIYTSGR